MTEPAPMSAANPTPSASSARSSAGLTVRKPLQRTEFHRSASSFTQRAKSLQRGKGLRAVSARKAKLDRVYLALRKAFLDANPYCKCGRPSEVVQHRQGRGSRYLDVTTWAARCRDCERDEHMHPERSYANGDLLRRNSA